MPTVAQISEEIQHPRTLDREIEDVLALAEKEIVYSLLKLLKKTLLISNRHYQGRVFKLLLEQEPDPLSLIKAVLILFRRNGTLEDKKLGYEAIAQNLKDRSIHYLISFGTQETNRKSKIYIQGLVQEILYSLSNKFLLKEINYYWKTCRKKEQKQLFLNQSEFGIVDCFGENSYKLAQDIIKAGKQEDLVIEAIQFLGQSTENESFEDLFISLLNKEKNHRIRFEVYDAISHLIEMKNRNEVYKRLTTEKDEKCLEVILSIVRKFKDTSNIESLIKMLDNEYSPDLVKSLIATLCSFENTRSFQLMKRAFNKGQNSASKVLVYKGYDFKYTEIKNLLKTSKEYEIKQLIDHIFHILKTEKQERNLLVNIYNVIEILYFSRSDELFNYCVDSYLNHTNKIQQLKLTLRHFVNIVQTEEEPMSTIAVTLITAFSRKFHSQIGTDKHKLILHNYIYTQLLSLNLSCNPLIRLVLLNYYNYFKDSEHQFHNNKMIQRFGFTILEYIFNQSTMGKRKQTAALSYLIQNLDNFIMVSGDSTIILNESLKQFMYKYPKEFTEFLELYFNPHQMDKLKQNKFKLELIKELMLFLWEKAQDVIMKRTIAVLIPLISYLYDIYELEDLERFLGQKIPQRFYSIILTKFKGIRKIMKKGQKKSEETVPNLTLFTQVMELNR